jgi:sulfur dioxygenase
MEQYSTMSASLIFRQLFDPTSSTYTYLLADAKSGDAILIDTVFEQAARDASLLAELGLTLKSTVDTHVHADHVTGAWLLHERFGSEIIYSNLSGAEGATLYVAHGEKVRFGSRAVTARATPGHTSGCTSFLLDDESMIFTGDALLIRGCGRTDFQQGDPATLFDSVHEQVFTLPEDCLVYPGHDYRGLTCSSVGEEKSFNPRLGGRILRDDFSGYMTNLGLAHPKLIDVAMPANLAVGKPQSGEAPSHTPDWGPLNLTFAGIWEIQPEWVAEHRQEVQLLDVREPDEFTGALGHIDGATLIPLGQLADQAASLNTQLPIVVVCRSGARSAQAVQILSKNGVSQAANLPGGMLAWRAQGLPAVDGGP